MKIKFALKVRMFFVASYYASALLEASDAKNIEKKIKNSSVENFKITSDKLVCNLEKDLLTDQKQDTMYKLYAAGKLTLEEVVEKKARSKQASGKIKLILQSVQKSTIKLDEIMNRSEA